MAPVALCISAFISLTGMAFMVSDSSAQTIGKPVPPLMTLDASVESSSVEFFEFDLPVLPLQEALDLFGDRTGLSGIYLASSTNGKTSSAVLGKYTAVDALQKLLQGSGLAAHFLTPSSFVLERVMPEERSELPMANEYESVVQNGIRDVFCNEASLAKNDYRAALRFYIDKNAHLLAPVLLDSTGDKQRDAKILAALSGVKFKRAPLETKKPFFMLILPSDAKLAGCKSH